MKYNILLMWKWIIIFLIICIPYSCNNITTEGDQQLLRVGVFNGEGASPVCVLETIEALRIDSGITAREISGADIISGALNKLDVLIFPGGSGSHEYNNLGQTGAEKVRNFARKEGHGLVGICAGGYLFSTTPGYPSLQITTAPDIRDHYDRGRGLIAFRLNEQGKKVFPELADRDSLFLQYYDGPMFETQNRQLTVLGSIITDIAPHPGYPRGVSPGKPMLMNGAFGQGKYFISVGHPEATAGMRWLVPRMARWAAGRPLISYTDQLVRPGINHKDILYYPETESFEKENFWNLFNNEDSVVIQAIDNLYRIRSRSSIRWSIGLLRHHSWPVRYKAAQYLYETEYTWAIPDIEAAYRTEQDKEHQAALLDIVKKLKAMVLQ
ncbi:MAG: hypothetical protein J7L89_01410 [Bacteroidales bacterium]|nr:hypothetical protein [Bacteroidales bacterium]